MSNEKQTKEESLKNYRGTALHLVNSICDLMESHGFSEATETIGVEVEIDGVGLKLTLDFRDEDELELDEYEEDGQYE